MFACGLAPPASAQVLERTLGDLTGALQNVLNLRPSDTTDWRIGVGPYVAPAFEGSRDYKVRPAPLISVRYRNVLRVDNNEVDFTAFDHVFDVGESQGRFSAGPVVNFDFGRGEDDSSALRGLGNVGFSLEIGGFVEFGLGPALIHFEMSQDVASGHKGADADLEASLTLLRHEKFAMSTTATLSWASASYMKSFFGITGTQSLRSGLPIFRAGSGLKSGAVHLAASYDINDHWALFGTATYKRLVGPAADSPLVVQRGSADQVSSSVFVVYKF